MDVVLGNARHVEVDHVADAFDVETASGDVRSDQDRDLVLLEPIELGDAVRLIHVTLDLACCETGALEARRQLADRGLAIGKDDGVLEFFVTKDVAQGILLLVGAHFDEANRSLFAFACYNAGPGNINRMRDEARRRGLDPDKWFNNVELVVAEKIGIETTTYVRNIYKYYVSYKLTLEAQAARSEALKALAAPRS